MNRKQWKLWLAGGAGVAVVATVAALSGPITSWAQDATPTAPTTEQRGAQDAPFGFGGGLHVGGLRGPAGMAGFVRGADGESLAEALGITVEELRAAQVEAANEAIDQALETGIITDEQASTIRERIASSEGGFPAIGFALRQRPENAEAGATADVEIDFDELLADALGITADELNTARESVREAAIAEAVASGEITQEQVELMEAQSALREYLAENGSSIYGEIVADAVAAGALTQTQADALLEAGVSGPFGGMRGFGGGAPGIIGAPNGDGPRGAPGGFGGPRGWGGELPSDPAQPASPLDESGDSEG